PRGGCCIVRTCFLRTRQVRKMETQRRNVLVLSGCQPTLQTAGATMISVTGLAGYALADDKSLATIPLTCYVLGSAITTIPASLLMGAIGRRGGRPGLRPARAPG